MATLTQLPIGAPAHADHNGGETDHNWVEVGYTRQLIPLDVGYIVLVLCNASALTSVQTDVPLATAVSCSINGLSANQANPGREAYTTVNDFVVGPYTVCISGQAAFVDPVTYGISVPSADSGCTTWPI